MHFSELRRRYRKRLWRFLPSPVRPLPFHRRCWWPLADRTGLTVYDASYLWLGRSRGAELATPDAKMGRRAQKPLTAVRANAGKLAAILEMRHIFAQEHPSS